MSAVEGRNRQYVHEGERHREKCRDVPERDPVPFCWKQTSDGAEPAYAFAPSLVKTIFMDLAYAVSLSVPISMPLGMDSRSP